MQTHFPGRKIARSTHVLTHTHQHTYTRTQCPPWAGPLQKWHCLWHYNICVLPVLTGVLIFSRNFIIFQLNLLFFNVSSDKLINEQVWCRHWDIYCDSSKKSFEIKSHFNQNIIFHWIVFISRCYDDDDEYFPRRYFTIQV